MLDRQEFFAAISDAVAGHTSALVPAGRAKTHVLEAHTDGSGPDSLLGAAVAGEGFSVRNVGDELWRVAGTDFVAFVDTLNPRFWQIHSTAAASLLRGVVRRMVYAEPRLDTAWLPTERLRQLDGEHTFIRSAFQADDLLGDVAAARRWRARFEGQAPEDLLELLSKNDRYGRTATVTQIGSLVHEPSVGRAAVVADYRGLFVTGAGDFSVAASAVWNLVRRYEEWVRALEDRHRVLVEPLEPEGFTLSGDVATLEFGREIEDLDRLVDGLFNAKAPFRLWAVPRQVDGEWTADAVDLHVGQPLRVQIGPTRLRVVLERETCGNTIARLLTNLQQRLDARTRLVAA